MAQQVVDFLGQFGISPELVIFIISLCPVLELRGGLIAAAVMHVPLGRAALLCFVGNILPLPFILLFIKQIFKFLRRYAFWEKIINRIESSATKRGESIKSAVWWGLFAFVAVPLPGTGGWTGALIAALLGLPVKRAFATIAVGVFCAGVVMLVLTYFIPGLFF